MTLRRTWRDLLISILSFACYPVVPVRLYFSEPAKSTSWSFDTVTLTGSLKSCDSIVKLKILWDRELKSLRLWLARIRLRAPYLYKSRTS